MVTHYSVNMDGILKHIFSGTPFVRTLQKVAMAQRFVGFLFSQLTLAGAGTFFSDAPIPPEFAEGDVGDLLRINPMSSLHTRLADAALHANRATVMLRYNSDFVDSIGIEVTFIGGSERRLYTFACNGEKIFS